MCQQDKRACQISFKSSSVSLYLIRAISLEADEWSSSSIHLRLFSVGVKQLSMADAPYVACQWQHCTWTFSFHTLIEASIAFYIFKWHDKETNTACPLWWQVVKPNVKTRYANFDKTVDFLSSLTKSWWSLKLFGFNSESLLSLVYICSVIKLQ